MKIYCTVCEKETKHILEHAPNGDFVYSCDDCGHFMKFPAEPTQTELEVHKQSNQHKK